VDWPRSADGDVFRRLQADSFDFSKACLIDFFVEFESGDPQAEVVSAIRHEYPGVQIIAGANDARELRVQVYSILEYDFVLATQKRLTELAEPFGGSCEAWGVLNG